MVMTTKQTKFKGQLPLKKLRNGNNRNIVVLYTEIAIPRLLNQSYQPCWKYPVFWDASHQAST
jgi:hypothetical protein